MVDVLGVVIDVLGVLVDDLQLCVGLGPFSQFQERLSVCRQKIRFADDAYEHPTIQNRVARPKHLFSFAQIVNSSSFAVGQFLTYTGSTHQQSHRTLATTVLTTAGVDPTRRYEIITPCYAI